MLDVKGHFLLPWWYAVLWWGLWQCHCCQMDILYRGKCVPKWGAKCVFNLWDEYFVAQRSLIHIGYITCAWGFSGIFSVIIDIQYLLIWTVTQSGLVTQYEYAIGHLRLSLPAVWCQAILCTWTNFGLMSNKHLGPNSLKQNIKRFNTFH